MDEALFRTVAPHIQAVARHMLAWRGSLESLITFVRYSLKSDTPTAATLDNFLRREDVQRELQAHWEVSLYRATDKSYRLIDLSIPVDPEVARRRINDFPASTTQCRYCKIDERSLAPIELRPELNIYREPVPRSMLHPGCMRSWLALRALVDRENAKNG